MPTTDSNRQDRPAHRRSAGDLEAVDLLPLHPLPKGNEVLASQFTITPRNGLIPKGTYLFRVKTDGWTELSRELPQRLFLDYGEGLSQANSVLLPPMTSDHTCGHFELLRPAHSMRLQIIGGLIPVDRTSVVLQHSSRLLFVKWRRLWQIFRTNPMGIVRKIVMRVLRSVARLLPAPVMGRIARGLKKLFRVAASQEYRQWLDGYQTLDELDRTAIRAHIEQLSYIPLISVLMPTYNPAPHHLRAAIDSVRSQLYPKWELCIADDNSTDPRVLELLRDFERMDDRIKIVFRSENGHISRATNSALALATGDYSALLDHDDLLSEDALYRVVAELQLSPDARLLYSDEDKVDEIGNRFEPFFKPSYSPDLLLSQNYVNHLGVYDTALLRRLRGMRTGFEGSQDHDLVLRFVEHLAPSQVRHIPRVLYHWRVTSGSTSAGASAKPYASEAGRRAIQEHLDRTGQTAVVGPAPAYPNYYRVRRLLPEHPPKASILIPLRDRVELLRACIDSIQQRTSYSNYELLILDNDSRETATRDYLNFLEESCAAKIYRYSGPFNYSAVNNFGARHARGDVLILLNNDVEVVSPDWLEELVGQALRPEVGVVGARLTFPDGTIQHAGVTLGIGGVASHAFYGSPRHTAKHFSHLHLLRNVSAVTGACLATRKSIFEEVGGLDEQELEVGYNDVDYCIRLVQQGYRVLYTPYAELVHHESKSRGSDLTGVKLERFLREQATVRSRWADMLNNDPFYNPNLSLTSNDFNLAWPPRCRDPWREAKDVG